MMAQLYTRLGSRLLFLLLLFVSCDKEVIQPVYEIRPPLIYAGKITGEHDIDIVNFTSQVPDAVLVTPIGGVKNIVVTQATATHVKFKVFTTSGQPFHSTNSFYYTIIINEQ